MRAALISTCILLASAQAAVAGSYAYVGIGEDGQWVAIRVLPGARQVVFQDWGDRRGNIYAGGFLLYDEREAFASAELLYIGTHPVSASVDGVGDAEAPLEYWWSPGGSRFEVGCATCAAIAEGLTIVYLDAGYTGRWWFSVFADDPRHVRATWGNASTLRHAGDFESAAGADVSAFAARSYATMDASLDVTSTDEMLGLFALADTTQGALADMSADGPSGEVACPCWMTDVVGPQRWGGTTRTFHLDGGGAGDAYLLVADVTLPE